MKNNYNTRPSSGTYLKLVIVIFIIAIAWLGYRYGLNPTAWISASTQAQPTFHGVISFTAAKVPASNSGKVYPSIYSYNFDSKDFVPVMRNYPATWFDHTQDSQGLMTAYLATSSDPDKLEPASVHLSTGAFKLLTGVNGYHETGIVASPDQAHYAFSYQKAGNLGQDNLNNWNIAIVDEKTKDVQTLTKAAKPQWLNGGTDLVYLRPDGLYQYSLQTQRSTKIEPSNGTLTNVDDIAASSNSQWIVFTAPDRSLITIFKASATSSAWTQSGIVITPNAHSRFPVISPDNTDYAVTAVNEADYDSSTDQYTKVSMQVRSLTSTAVAPLVSIPVTGFYPQSVQLGAWYTQ